MTKHDGARRIPKVAQRRDNKRRQTSFEGRARARGVRLLNPRQGKHERAVRCVIYRKSPLTMSKMCASLIIARKLLPRQWIFDNCETRSTGRLVRVNLLITSAVPAANRELRAIRMNTSCGFIRADIKRNYRRAGGRGRRRTVA